MSRVTLQPRDPADRAGAPPHAARPPAPRPARRSAPAAFTLAEILVVIAILVLILAVAVPAFASMIYSSARATAQNSLAVAMQAARDAAVRSTPGRDAAAVFFYEPGGRLSVVPCVSVGVLGYVSNNQTITREVFVPAPGVEPVQLPAGWMVNGYAAAGTIGTSNWYTDDKGNKVNYDKNTGNWVFPESGFYAVDKEDEGANRRTFMIRFQGGTGTVDTAEGAAVWVLAPSRSLAFRDKSPWKDHPAHRATDLARFITRVVGGGLSDSDREKLLGDVATDTVLVRPVPAIAVYNVRRVAGFAGARGLNRASGSLYLPDKPELDGALFAGGGKAQAVEKINRWIEHNTDDWDNVASDAIVYTLDRYSGRLQQLVKVED